MADRTIWIHPEDSRTIQIVDQRQLPHQYVIADLKTTQDTATAIRDMWVRGAPLIGATAGFGMYLACLEDTSEQALRENALLLSETRPTAVNLQWAIDRQLDTILPHTTPEARITAALEMAKEIVEEDVELCRSIGVHGLKVIQKIHGKQADRPVQILTHCNAGRMATVEWGTATSPIYQAHQAGIPVHVWVDETRPRNQGARITAWELAQAGIPHTVISDNVGGHLMQHGQVDLCIVGTDRTTRTGDVANKIGTYLKALAAHDNSVPFYVAVPSSSIDWNLRDGLAEIPIEERGSHEVTHIRGWDGEQIREVRLTPENSPALNFGFDVTPARFVSGLITERGICTADEAALLKLFPERG